MKALIDLRRFKVTTFVSLLGLLLVYIGTPICAQESLPSWTNLTGKTIQGEFIRIDSDILYIFMNDKEFGIPLATLSRISQDQARAVADKIRPEWQARAVKMYPDLSIPTSPFYQLFVNSYKQRRQTAPAFFANPQWSLLLAHELSDRPEFTREGSITGRLVEYENIALSSKLNQMAKQQGVGIINLPPDGRLFKVMYYYLETASEGRLRLYEQSEQVRDKFPGVNYGAPVIITGK
ncbi:MAG: hypothetical protein Q8M07_32510, partial [Prosthecobacter sp.]|nr:hypothetical protein [Prosthecobacter sp.]